ncbi:hypothetical protein CYMTET_6973 [Cymbomonas tetramitiformis]|uniref:Uncharacterized protein n=1 Tax=Cymbomonas tetramitiformis TaxID=36881 RepID=A0AAE0LHY5_9CHLO|nr:hypothetical protein CYMTET_6973 [Cymbomonas tetramitiformis]
MFDIFKKKVDPKVEVRKWQSKIRSEMRAIDRQIRDIKREEDKVVKAIKEASKRNDTSSAKILAKEVVVSRRTTQRLHTNKAQMNSVSMHLGENLAVIRTVGHLEKSTEVMTLMNSLIKTPVIAKQMQELSKEMMKSGMIEEMVTDALDMVEDDFEDETEEEVDKILTELASESVKDLPDTTGLDKNKPAKVVVQPEPAAAEEPEAEEEPILDDEFAGLQARLGALRS